MKSPITYPLLHTIFLIVSVMFIFFSRSSEGIATEMINNNTKLPIRQSNKSSVSAIYVFGDSTVDPGNNNYIKTAGKSNFPPYGRDFPNHIPTGRFSNGRLVTDFVASYAGLKENVPPYLDPTLSIEELMSGVSFASAYSGYDPLTANLAMVIPLSKQLEYFREYKARIEKSIGKKKTEDLINNALFIISAGTNDFSITYFVGTTRRLHYSVSSYQQFVLQLTQQFIQDLWAQGGRRIGVVGLPPIGCVPAVITLFSNDGLHRRNCVESLSSIARDYNRMLQIKLKSMKLRGAQIVYGDIYKPLDEAIQRPDQLGFEKVNIGCCGTGLIEAAILCNPKTVVCSDVSKYVFWDAIHPTQKTYFLIFESLLPAIDFILS